MTRLSWVGVGIVALVCAAGVGLLARNRHQKAVPLTQVTQANVSAGQALEPSGLESVAVPQEPQALPLASTTAREGVGLDTVHVRGRVIFPPGMPSGERVRLYARATPDSSNSTTIAVSEDGSFDATLPSSWHAIGLDLNAPSLCSPATTWVYLDSGDQQVELRAELACQLEIRILLPAGVTESELADALGTVTLYEGPNSTPLCLPITVRLSETRVARFDKVPQRDDVQVCARFPPFRPGRLQGVSVIPGQPSRLDVEVARGARVRGEVVDAEGKPVVGVEVFSLFATFDGPGGIAGATTDSRGAFDFSGLPNGTDRLMVMSKLVDGRTRSIGSLNVSSLAAGKVIENLRIVVTQ